MVSTRERYDLDQVLVINSSGQVRVNITTQSSMSRSDVAVRLGGLPADAAGTVVLLKDERHSLLVGRAQIWAPGEADRRGSALGTIYTVLDISAETGRLRRSLELQSALQLAAGRVVAATLPELQAQPLALDRRDAVLSDGGRYCVLTTSFSLGSTPVQLALLRSEEAINAIVFAGFQVMLISSGVTLLLALGVMLARSLTQPIRTLAGVASAFAAGDLNCRARLDTLDEIGQLGHALDHAADTIALLLDQQGQNLGELQAILTSIADGVLAIDARAAIVQVNPAALALLGRQADALVGWPLDLLLQSDEIGLEDGLHQIVGQLRAELTDATLSVTEGRVTLGPRVLGLRSAPIVSGGAERRLQAAPPAHPAARLAEPPAGAHICRFRAQR